MNFKYSEREILARVWTHPGANATTGQALLPIPRKLQIRGQSYDVVDLFCRVTKSQSIWLQDPKLNREHPGPGGRRPKYDEAAWIWIRHAEPKEIAEHYRISLAYAKTLKKNSLKSQIPQKT